MKHKVIHIKDYRKPTYEISDVHLTFELDEERTIVTNQMKVKRVVDSKKRLKLRGEGLKLLSLKIDGIEVPAKQYKVEEKRLIIHSLPSICLIETVCEINPKANTALEGLYLSGGIFCTQNEPEGFRRITYFLDRPDVMTSYTTKIIADKVKCPILLANGNEIKKGDLEDGKHFAVWKDPFVKPSYLFALVGGDLGLIRDRFTTKSGREIDLRIYCDKGNESKCSFAMECLIKSMKWDEDVFGLEYDLDIYMIVAVDTFNMGAMENKGLNIFNSSCVLADAEIATDDNYLRVETVICHEYFHNWTGNRVTCRDWFQLTLKEGLTVFRDQEFSSDMNDRAVKRIEDVIDLRTRQFPEDAGPNSHPIQPKTFIEINNFYTATVYDKGAEVIRMIHTLLGKETFCKGITTYFDLYDGMAVTTEEFIHSMEVASGRSLDQFRLWYSQKGTPILKIRTDYDHSSSTLSITISQKTSVDEHHYDLNFPFNIGLLGSDGKEIMPTKMLEITKRKETFTFEGITEIPKISLNRNFSAPVILNTKMTIDDYVFLMRHDTDPFVRFESGQEIALQLMLELVESLKHGEELTLPPQYIEAYRAILSDEKLSPALKEKLMLIPTEGDVGLHQSIIEFDEIHEVREWLCFSLATSCKDELISIYDTLNGSADTIGKRKLKNRCLRLLTYLGDRPAFDRCIVQYNSSQNMTDAYAAMSALAEVESNETEEILSHFYDKWKDDNLVINKWFTVQAGSKREGTLEKVKDLLQDPAYNESIPNHARALLGAFTENHIHFHQKDGKGYEFMSDMVIHIDAKNPILAAKLAHSFDKFEKLDPVRKESMEYHMKRIVNTSGLSNNTFEIISKSLKRGVEPFATI